MLKAFNAKGLLKTRGRQRTDSTHILSNVRLMTRLEHVTETMRAALNALASYNPESIQGITPIVWFERYSRRAEEYHLPRGKQVREDFIASVGDDGYTLIELVSSKEAPLGIKDLPAVDALCRMWALEYICENGRSRWREGTELGAPRERFSSPYDTEAHHGIKGSRGWDGYKVHFTETCDQDMPNVITHVETTSAVLTDVERTQAIQEALNAKQIGPGEHVVDSGYVSAKLFVSSQKRGMKLVGPARPMQGWQAHTEGAYDITKFKVNFKKQMVTCPQEKKSASWKVKPKPNQIHVRFKRSDCMKCRFRALCLKSVNGARSLTFQPEQEFKMLYAQRALVASPDWKTVFNARAGIEGSAGCSSLGVATLEVLW